MKAMKVGLLSALSILTVTAYAADPTGNFTCSRTDAAGKSATYTLSVSKTGDTYTYQWNDSSGYPIQYGTGVMTTTLNNLISVIFWDATDQKKYGNELFMIKPDGSLSSNWTLHTDTQVGTEVCKKS